MQQYPLTGAQLVQGIYDPHRDLYYFTDATKIQIFSKTQGAWLPAVPITRPQGAAAERLWGIALSPNGSKLAISDLGASVIYLVDPTNMASVQTFQLATPPSPSEMGTSVSAASGSVWRPMANHNELQSWRPMRSQHSNFN